MQWPRDVELAACITWMRDYRGLWCFHGFKSFESGFQNMDFRSVRVGSGFQLGVWWWFLKLTTNPVYPWPSSQVTTTPACSPCSQPLHPQGRGATSEISHRRIFTRSSQPTWAITTFAWGTRRTQPFLDPSLAGGFHCLICLPRFVRHREAGGPSDPPVESLHPFSPVAQTPQLSPGT